MPNNHFFPLKRVYSNSLPEYRALPLYIYKLINYQQRLKSQFVNVQNTEINEVGNLNVKNENSHPSVEECGKFEENKDNLKNVWREVWTKNREMEEIYTAEWRMRKEVLKKPGKNKDKKRNMKEEKMNFREALKKGCLDLQSKVPKDNCIC
jgi:hypothetical protein